MNNITALLRAYSEHPIAYFPVYTEITGSVTAGVLLSQVLYWWHQMNERQFYKVDHEFADELSMGLYEFRGARKKLIETGLIYTERKGLPRKTHYTVDEDRLVAFIASVRKNPTQEEGENQHRSEEKPNTPRAETTHETTAEITEDVQREKAALQVPNVLDELADKIIDYLNEKAGTRYRHSKASRKFIRARIREGATEGDCRIVIEHKVSKWLFDPAMAEYLRPTTLFRPTHFEEYLAAAIRWHETGRQLTDEAEKQKARARSQAVIAEAEKRGMRRTGPDGNPLPVSSPAREIMGAIGGGFGDGF